MVWPEAAPKFKESNNWAAEVLHTAQISAAASLPHTHTHTHARDAALSTGVMLHAGLAMSHKAPSESVVL